MNSSTLLIPKSTISKKVLTEFKVNMKNTILTSRFSNETWEQNVQFRKKMGDKVGCIYCSPDMISSSVPLDSIMFILEMNNTNNRIMGVGMVKNIPAKPGKYNVYEDGNYNRYVYVGKYRIDRTNMDEMEEKIMHVFDILCFTGNKHMKRGKGLKSFPIDMVFRCSKIVNFVDFITNMFKKRYFTEIVKSEIVKTIN